jgi:hypothetical protein
VSKLSRPPVAPGAERGLSGPTPRDRERIREGIERAVARSSASPTVLRVDASMAERALRGTSSVGLFGSKLAFAKVVIPALLIGAGLGAIWARALFTPSSDERPASQSLPVKVEDLDAFDEPMDRSNTSPSDGESTRLVAGDALAHESSAEPLQPFVKSGARHVRAGHHGHNQSHASEAHARSKAPVPANEPAAAEPATVAVPEVPSHHLAEELRLMRAASAALASNDVQRTLNLLADHAERFPDGALREERRALRVISLCKQGRSHFALVERDEFLSSSPRSPLTARVREACESPP